LKDFKLRAKVRIFAELLKFCRKKQLPQIPKLSIQQKTNESQHKDNQVI